MAVSKKKKEVKEPTIEENKETRQFQTILAIDYSYDECGFSLWRAGTLIRVSRLNFKMQEEKIGKKLRKKHKRKILQLRLAKEINGNNVHCIILERVRLFSAGFVSADSMIALGELVATIIDALPDSIPVYSVDTRSWKKAALGTSKSGPDKKQLTLDWANIILPEEEKIRRKYRALTHNEADAIGIGYAYYQGIKIKQEE